MGDNEETREEQGTGKENGGEVEKKTFTQDDIDRIITSRLAKERAKWEKDAEVKRTEAEKLAQMKADERAKYEQEKREEALTKREQEITTRELKAQAYETLAEKGLPKDLIEIIDTTSAERCNASIARIEKTFGVAVQSAVNEKLKGKTPGDPGGTTGGSGSKVGKLVSLIKEQQAQKR